MTELSDESEDPFESETDFIRFLTRTCRSRGMTVDFTDDCAQLDTFTELVSTDTIIAGKHFSYEWTTPKQIGRQAAVVSLSDLAGSGARATWALLSLNLPNDWNGERLRALCFGFIDILAEHGICLKGGNCSHTDGPLNITVTVGGNCFGDHPITRSTAHASDIVCVSGELGRSAMLLKYESEHHAQLRHSWRPHFEESEYLVTQRIPTSMMDISDGLFIDAERLARASGIDIHINSSMLPILPESHQYSYNDAMDCALFGGEDYVLLFTCAQHTSLPSWVFPIGTTTKGDGSVLIDGQPISKRGFDHFRILGSPQ